MAILNLEIAGSPVLKKKCEPIKKIDARLRHLLDDMAETMYKYNGIGIAAPQIGKNICAVVIDVGDGKIELINPVIKSREGSEIDSEGCLSVPEIFGDVERAAKITCEYTTRYGKRRTMEAEHLLARCIQHECDHLNGVLFIDIAKNLRRETDDDDAK
ncbi:MAG: peptide deformylase [Schwartzia sp.]|nr:peptide deformylase [Schwartzia sp. (in: firmicutes)]